MTGNVKIHQLARVVVSNDHYYGSAQPRVRVWCVGSAALLVEHHLRSLPTAPLDAVDTFFLNSFDPVTDGTSERCATLMELRHCMRAHQGGHSGWGWT